MPKKMRKAARMRRNPAGFICVCVLPALILVYVRLGNPGFMDPVYTGLRGRFFMSACLAVYALAVWLGQRLIQFEV